MANAANPFDLLNRWLQEAREAGVPAPGAMALSTATAAGEPSVRMVSLKRLDGAALVFTTALWSRKVEELRANPAAAAVFYWPALGRQVRIEGRAEVAERELAERLFDERLRGHQLQAVVSRQGQEIESVGVLRARLNELEQELDGAPMPCPEDWGAIRLLGKRVEFWQEADDRLHTRELYERAENGWRRSFLAP